MTNRLIRCMARIALLLLAGLCSGSTSTLAQPSGSGNPPGTAGEPYPHMPSIAPIGVRIGKYAEIPDAAKGPAIDSAKGYRLQKLGTGLYMVTDNVYQSMFLVYDRGVVVVDVPPDYATRIPQAIAEVVWVDSAQDSYTAGLKFLSC